MPWGEAIPGHDDLQYTPADLFRFYAVDNRVQGRGNQQVDAGQEDMNERGSTLAEMVNHAKPVMGMYRIRTARMWDRQLLKALRCSLWDVM